MSKNVKIEYNDKVYELSFTKRTVRDMEGSGFRRDAIFDMPATMIPMLFGGSFQAKCPNVTSKIREEIFDNVKDKTDFIAKLVEMYDDTVTSLLETNESSESKNVSWEANW